MSRFKAPLDNHKSQSITQVLPDLPTYFSQNADGSQLMLLVQLEFSSDLGSAVLFFVLKLVGSQI